MEITVKEIFRSLQKIAHPVEGSDIVSLGYVQQIKINGNEVNFTLTFKTDRDPHIREIHYRCIEQLESDFPGIDVRNRINIRVLKKEKPSTGLDGVKNIIGVASGKGGVGKSTVAVNLAVGLSRLGFQVGLLDADIYGPSLPQMTGLNGAVPAIIEQNGSEVIQPIAKFGIKLMSIGFFVNPRQPLIWRGAMATSALKQIMLDPDWGELDYLIIDMPPGTGDVHLTIVQSVALTGVVVVTTPQQVAIADVVKGINMFRNDSINVPILGLVENMAWFTPAELPNNKYYIFGKEKLDAIAEEFSIPILGKIPIFESIVNDSDQGEPSALKENVVGEHYLMLAKNVNAAVEKRHREFPPTRIVQIKS